MEKREMSNPTWVEELREANLAVLLHNLALKASQRNIQAAYAPASAGLEQMLVEVLPPLRASLSSLKEEEVRKLVLNLLHGDVNKADRPALHNACPDNGSLTLSEKARYLAAVPTSRGGRPNYTPTQGEALVKQLQQNKGWKAVPLSFASFVVTVLCNRYKVPSKVRSKTLTTVEELVHEVLGGSLDYELLLLLDGCSGGVRMAVSLSKSDRLMGVTSPHEPTSFIRLYSWIGHRANQSCIQAITVDRDMGQGWCGLKALLFLLRLIHGESVPIRLVFLLYTAVCLSGKGLPDRLRAVLEAKSDEVPISHVVQVAFEASGCLSMEHFHRRVVEESISAEVGQEVGYMSVELLVRFIWPLLCELTDKPFVEVDLFNDFFTSRAHRLPLRLRTVALIVEGQHYLPLGAWPKDQPFPFYRGRSPHDDAAYDAIDGRWSGFTTELARCLKDPSAAPPPTPMTHGAGKPTEGAVVSSSTAAARTRELEGMLEQHKALSDFNDRKLRQRESEAAEAREEVKALQATAHSLQRAMKALEQQLHGAAQTRVAAEMERQDARREAAALREALLESQSLVEILQSQVKEDKAVKLSLQVKLQQQDQDLRQMQDAVKGKNAQIARLEREVEVLSKAKDAAERETRDAEAQSESLKTALEQKSLEVAFLREEQRQKDAVAEHRDSEIKMLKSQLACVTAAGAQADGTMKEMAGQMKDLRRTLEQETSGSCLLREQLQQTEAMLIELQGLAYTNKSEVDCLELQVASLTVAGATARSDADLASREIKRLNDALQAARIELVTNNLVNSVLSAAVESVKSDAAADIDKQAPDPQLPVQQVVRGCRIDGPAPGAASSASSDEYMQMSCVDRAVLYLEAAVDSVCNVGERACSLPSTVCGWLWSRVGGQNMTTPAEVHKP